MLSKKALKNWLITLGVLVIVIFAVKYLKSSKKSSFRTKIVEIDTTKVSLIEIYQGKKIADAMDLLKKEDKWYVKQNNEQYSANKKSIKNLISEILQIRPERLAAKSKDKWKKYNVEDSSAIHLLIKEDNKTTLDLLVGRFSAEKSNNPYSQRPDMYTYVRVNGENETYLVSGFLSMALSTEVSRYRNTLLTNLKPTDIKKLIFSYPDSSFTVENLNDKWVLNGNAADSTKTASYISDISRLMSSSFASKKRIQNAQKQELFKLRIEGNNFTPVELKAFPVDSTMLIRSTSNKDGVFLGDKSDLKNKIFVGKQKFQ